MIVPSRPGRRFAPGWLLPILVLGLTEPAAAEASPEPALRTLSDYMYYRRRGAEARVRGDFREAERRFRQAIETLRPHEAATRLLLSGAYGDLAVTLHDLGRDDDAEPLARWSLRVREAKPGVKPALLYESLFLLGTVQHARGRNAEAEGLLGRALAVQESDHPPEHPALALTLDELAGVETELGRFDVAEPLYKRALALREAARDPADAVLAETLEHYAAYLRRIGRGVEAGPVLERARAVRDVADTRRARANPARPVSRARPGP